VLGFNSRLDTLQAVVLRAKLRRLRSWNEQRQAGAQAYARLLGDSERVRVPVVLPGNEHVWHLYVVRVADRDGHLQRLSGAGIGAGIHYPIPIHLQGALADHGFRPGQFPVAERAAGEILSLPLFPGITPEQQERVAGVLRTGG
jgi:dTDP-4-amino-4,6-dideoxygalactose transaminase